jgi:hypothetical protein
MTIRTATLSLAALALIGCDGMGNKRSADAAEASETVTPPAPRVISTEIGSQAGESLRVTEVGTRFGARDTVYLAVVTSNARSDSKLSARWTFEDGTMVDSSGQGIARSTGTANAVTQFRIARDEGWLVGDYTVNIWLNDMLVETKSFVVER